MDFGFDDRTREMCLRLTEFMASHIYPAEPVFTLQVALSEDPWATPVVVAELQREARERGLWNLFLPGSEYGAGLTNLQYAPLAEITGRSPRLAPVALNCAAPDSGNMAILASHGTEQQRKEWLLPLLDGQIRSAFAMTEPDVASSDARNIETVIDRDGDDLVVTGRKWFVTGALNPRCEFLVVLGRTDPSAGSHQQHSMVIVPRDIPGVEIGRGMHVLGYTDGDHGGHAEVRFDGVRIPAVNMIGGPGAGFGIAQARLGPARIHHCMRLIGMAERAMELMCARVKGRSTFGVSLARRGVVQDWIAESRVRIEQLRLLALKAAWLMDTAGDRAAHTEIQAVKIAVPRTVEWVIDKAIQVHGAAGLSQDTPLASLWAQARALRVADGPDEVHKRSLARRELRRGER